MTYNRIKPLKNKNKRVDQELLPRKSDPVHKKRALQGKIIGQSDEMYTVSNNIAPCQANFRGRKGSKKLLFYLTQRKGSGSFTKLYLL